MKGLKRDIDKVVEAEAAAKKRISDAEERAREIRSSTLKNEEKLRKESRKKADLEVKGIKEHFEITKRELEQKSKNEVDKLIQKLEKAAKKKREPSIRLVVKTILGE
jgi:hypothetical protein